MNMREVAHHRFWMVKGAGPANARHSTKHLAEMEARRLAHMHRGEWFYVVEAVLAIRDPKPEMERIDLTDEIPF